MRFLIFSISYRSMRPKKSNLLSFKNELILIIIVFLGISGYVSTNDVDCSFNNVDSEFCAWKPNLRGLKIWHSSNAVLVDSVNSIVKPPAGGE